MDRLVIGVDPGLANTGYGIIAFSCNRFRCVSYGDIKTDAKLPHAQRLFSIYSSLILLLQEHKPTEAGIETLYFAKNTTSALSVSEARGVVILALYSTGIREIGEYAPNAIKKAVTGIAQATKEQVQDATKLLLGLAKRPKPNHAADALAAAITKINMGNIIV